MMGGKFKGKDSKGYIMPWESDSHGKGSEGKGFMPWDNLDGKDGGKEFGGKDGFGKDGGKESGKGEFGFGNFKGKGFSRPLCDMDPQQYGPPCYMMESPRTRPQDPNT